MSFFLIIFVTLLVTSNFAAVVIEKDKNVFEYIEPTKESEFIKEDKTFWYNVGQDFLTKVINKQTEKKKVIAKNVVIMIGDGMGIPTITATRIYKGQRKIGKTGGEEYNLVSDNFPNVALVKTYNIDMQIPDSAATATALFTGVKTRFEAVGVDVSTSKNVTNKETFSKSKVSSIMDWAQQANKSTGIITTTRITHATPAATYAHVHHRSWECESKIPSDFKFVKDIARQLVEDLPGRNFKVIMGGGYQQLGYVKEDLSNNDECVRKDNLNLTDVWLKNHKNSNASFITNNEQLQNLKDSDYVLGLFHPDHIPYELTRDKTSKGTPSLSEMTQKGLEILKKDPNGFVLMVEGGRIDLAHHKNYARLALEEASEFDKTIGLVVENTDEDTLILVTADHSHSMTMNGYSHRGNDILGFGIESEDDKPSLTITYANGPGFAHHYGPNDSNSNIMYPWIDARTDPSRLNNPKYQHLAAFEREDETHGGEDVAIFATGPGSFLIQGVFEQNYVAHMISYTACIGPNADKNPNCAKSSSCTNGIVLWMLVLVLLFLIV